MDKNFRQQNHPEPLNRSLALPMTLIATLLTYVTAVWGHLKEKERSSEVVCAKGFPAPGSLLRPRFQGQGTDLLRVSICRRPEHKGSPSNGGTCSLPCQPSPVPGNAHPQCQRIIFYLLIFHIQKFVIFPITFQFIETHKATWGVPRVCA